MWPAEADFCDEGDPGAWVVCEREIQVGDLLREALQGGARIQDAQVRIQDAQVRIQDAQVPEALVREGQVQEGQ